MSTSTRWFKLCHILFHWAMLTLSLSYAKSFHWAMLHPTLSYATPHTELCHTLHWAMPHPSTELCHAHRWAMPHKIIIHNVYYLWLQLRWTSWWRRSSWASSTTPTSSTSSGSASTSIPGKENRRKIKNTSSLFLCRLLIIDCRVHRVYCTLPALLHMYTVQIHIAHSLQYSTLLLASVGWYAHRARS